jgi:uncharacterized protein
MKNKIENNPIIFIVAYFIFMAAFHKIPLQILFEKDDFSHLFSSLISKTIINLFIVTISFCVIYYLNINRITGISLNHVRGSYFYILPFFYLYLLSFNLAKIQKIPPNDFFSPLIIIFILKSLSVGLMEEIVFRGIAQVIILRKYLVCMGLLPCVFVISFLFGLGHIINIINLHYSVVGVMSQIIMATCIGFLFSTIVLKTENIYPIILIHSINHFFSHIILVFPDIFLDDKKVAHYTSIEIFASVVVTAMIFGIPTILPSWYILKSIDIDRLEKQLMTKKMN